MKLPIYMDSHATTPVDPEVFRAMEPYFSRDFGNAASKSHVFGWKAEAAVEAAREEVAEVLGCDPEEIIFTSGATESNNMALLGVARARGEGHIITVQTEHNAVLDPCRHLEAEGFEVTYLPVDKKGRLDLDGLKNAIRLDTILISVMAANNEIGTLAPLEPIGETAREAGILFHSDAAQAVGKVPLNVGAMKLDLLSLSGHKIYGPKGIGALYVRRNLFGQGIRPVIFGGGHERELRPGTLNVPGVVGLGKALRLCREKMPEESRSLMELRERLWKGLRSKLEGVHVNGSWEHRLPQNLNLRFDHVPAERLIMELKDIAVSTGSACTSAKPDASHVLRALGLSEREAKSSIRLGLSRFTTEEEVDYVVGRIVEVVAQIRAQPMAEAGS